MGSGAPIEIWEEILKYAISVTLFFDPDPATTWGVDKLGQYVLEGSYWQSERTRNRLRRVCNSWDQFLQGYNYRYVRISDVLHRRIPRTAIPKAIRLNIEMERSCNCEFYCGKPGALNSQTMARRLRRLTMQLLSAVIDNNDFLAWKLEIFHWAYEDDLFLREEPHPDLFAQIRRRAPKIGALIGGNVRELADLKDKGEGMRGLFTYEGGRSTTEIIWPLAFQMKHLTTLQLARTPNNLETADWDLPSLRHLSIRAPPYDLPSPSDAARALMMLLERVGRNLLTFYYGGYSTFDVPTELWTHAPMLERIQMSYWPLNSPPAFHPVRYVRLSSTLLGWWKGNRENRSILKFLPGWGCQGDDGMIPSQGEISPNLIVQWERTWLYELLWSHETMRLIYVAQLYQDRGVKFTDSDGVTLDEYIVFLIETYWKAGRASRAPNSSQDKYTNTGWVYRCIF